MQASNVWGMVLHMQKPSLRADPLNFQGDSILLCHVLNNIYNSILEGKFTLSSILANALPQVRARV